MKRSFALACLAILAGCSNGKAPDAKQMMPPPSGLIFDPCTASPQDGYDPATHGLPACCSDVGGAHCVPNDEVLPTLQTALMKCDDKSVCMPDSIIRAGGKYTPPACTSSVGQAKGVCLSRCIELLASNPSAAVLGRDGCGDDELCVPCVNPINGTNTGACEIVSELCGGDMAMSGSGAMCPHTGPPVIEPSTLPPCSPTCGGAHCLPAKLVPAGQQSLLSACTAADGGPGYCAPDPLIAAGGNLVPRSCTSVAGAEGRCLSTCLPSVASEAGLLPRDVCDAGEKCTPCFNPFDADPTKPTGACTISCDHPAKDPVILTCPWKGPPAIDPKTQAQCSPQCGGSHCISADFVPASVQPLLATCKDSAGQAGFCAPDDIIKAGGQYVPPTCTSVAGAEGRCLSLCLPSVAEQASLLPQDLCSPGSVCVPCYNPAASDPTAPTGACNLACDKPTKPPVVLSCPWDGTQVPVIDPTLFPDCCSGAHCVPKSLVPQNEQSLLASCDNDNGLCAPDPIIASDNHFVPKSCTSVAGAEGRCLSTCLPAIKSELAVLPQDVCAANERCAPCFDPTSSDPTKPTGACGLACDLPAKPPVTLSCPYNGPPVIDPNTLTNCSSPTCSNAHCLPAALVPPDQAGKLAPCAGGTSFCTPDPVITSDNHWVPPSCVSIAGAEGRCLSTCLPDVAAKAALLPQSTCAPNNRCVPCYDPTSATPDTPTSACALACDKPTQAPVHLGCPWSGPAVIDPAQLPQCSPSCLGAHCLPAQYVPGDEQKLLAQCGDGFCTPDNIIKSDNNYVPQSCDSIAGAEGRCLSACLPMVAALGNLLPQGRCGTNEKCVPCFNPTAANPDAATGACSLACDQPKKPPVHITCPWNGNPAVIDPSVLPGCCNGAHCLPADYVPPSQQSQLNACATGGFCTPDPMIINGGDYKPPTCVAFTGTSLEGRCLSTCLPQVAAQPSLETSTCTSGLERCVPCYQPLNNPPNSTSALPETGACRTVSCDAPGPARGFDNCCFDNGAAEGKCVPLTQLASVPSDQQSHMKRQECANDNLRCVPFEQLPGGQTKKCTVKVIGIPSGTGTCYSNCLDLTWVSVFLGQSDCPNNHTCVP